MPRLELQNAYRNPKIRLLGNLSRCEFRYLQSPDYLVKSLNRCSKREAIRDIKMVTEILQGVTYLIKECTDPLLEYENWHFVRSSFTDIYLPLGPTLLYRSPNNYINLSFCLCIYTGWEGLVSPFTSFSSTVFEKFRVLPQKYIQVIRIVEYFTIPMLNYFEDALANVGLSEAWLKWCLNCMTQTGIFLLNVSLIE